MRQDLSCSTRRFKLLWDQRSCFAQPGVLRLRFHL